MKIIQNFGKNIIIDKKTAELSKLFGMSPRTVSNGLHDLVHYKYLNKVVRPNGAGRPINRYNDTPKLIKYLSELSNESTDTHKKIIDGLLKDKDAHPLKIPQRLLLAVMLSWSDKGGVVRDLGISDLSSLTGLSKDSVKSQLKTLVSSKYIISYIPGVTGKFLIGTAKSVYQMSLHHDSYAIDENPSKVIIVPSHENINSITASSIYQLAGTFIKKNSPEMGKLQYKILEDLTKGNNLFNKFELFFEFFNIIEMREVIEYFQQSLDQYVSSLLTYHWEELLSIAPKYFDTLKEQIEKETLPMKLIKGNEKDFPSTEQRELLFKFVYDIVVYIAKDIVNMLNYDSDLHDTSAAYNILPNIDKFGKRNDLLIYVAKTNSL
ncbi:hypothetical protein [Colwellia sp. 20A7]|uniref:hypothetical protein n=1 Tax=Colwellia sp. 20A7 TaxID=2689569 RepID=UPI00135C31A3|nr:hypothetical protein [Colwellia sp. 20A7]